MGEIMIRGYCVMLGYWADQDKTNECITESGWYKTGWEEAELQTQHNKKNIKKFTQEKKIYTSTGNFLNAAADVSLQRHRQHGRVRLLQDRRQD